MPSVQRTSPLAIIASAAIGAAAGLLLQMVRSSIGHSPFIPPYSLPITLALFGMVVLLFGLLLRRAVTRETGGNVNPFSAVRVLAASRASQFVGALFFGFGLGLLASLIGRSVAAPIGTWLPMVTGIVASLLLTLCGAIAEHLCRVPPSGGEGDDEAGEAGGPDTLDQPA